MSTRHDGKVQAQRTRSSEMRAGKYLVYHINKRLSIASAQTLDGLLRELGNDSEVLPIPTREGNVPGFRSANFELNLA